MSNDKLWDLERNWREINYLFHHLERLGIIKKAVKTKILGDQEKLNEIDIFTKRLVKEINEHTAGGLLFKLRISAGIPTPIDNKNAKDILIMLFDYNNLEPALIKWIRQNNTELINYLWSFLTMAEVINETQILHIPKFYHLKSDDIKSIYPAHYASLDRRFEASLQPYRKLKLDKSPVNIEEKYKNIIKFLDLWPVELHIKQKQIKIFESRCLSIKNKNKMRQWLCKNSDLNDWSWSFIKSNFLNNKTPYWVSDIDNMNEEARNEEIENTLVTLYNLIEIPEAKALMMANLSRAASQFRYREKSKKDEKLYINVVISTENKSNFDELKNRLRMNSEDTLSYLIDLGIKNTYTRKMDLF